MERAKADQDRQEAELNQKRADRTGKSRKIIDEHHKMTNYANTHFTNRYAHVTNGNDYSKFVRANLF